MSELMDRLIFRLGAHRQSIERIRGLIGGELEKRLSDRSERLLQFLGVELRIELRLMREYRELLRECGVSPEAFDCASETGGDPYEQPRSPLAKTGTVERILPRGG
jgi:hypothetical protein